MFYKCNSVIKINVDSFENLSFNETVFDSKFCGAAGGVFSLYFSTASNRVSGGNASISSTLQNQVRYKDPKSSKEIWICNFLSFNFGFPVNSKAA
jgi:hypothetical protein